MSNFPNWGQLVEVDILTKMEKKCINVAKSLFLEQNTRDIGGGANATFLNTLGIPLIHSQPSSLQETLNWGQLELQGSIVLYFAEIVFAQETLRAS